LCNGAPQRVSYLVIYNTDRSEALIPQLNVSRNFCGYLRSELRGQNGVHGDVAGGVVVAEHLARTGKRKRLNRDIGLVEDADGVCVRRVGEEGGAEWVEISSVRVVSRV
jgi:hypothetical protein